MMRWQKYGNRRTEYAGQVYASAAEARYAVLLEALKRTGVIRSWERAPSYELISGPTRQRRVSYRPDFLVTKPNGEQYVVEVKGSMAAVSRDFRLRALLFQSIYPGLPLMVVDGNGRELDPFAPRPRRRRMRRAA